MVGSVRGVVLVVLAVAGCRPSGGPPAPTAESAPTASVEAVASSAVFAGAGASAVGSVAPSASSASASSASAPASAPSASASASGDAAIAERPVTPIAKLTKLSLQQMQGGPSVVRCKGVAYAVSIDLAKNEWTYGLCVPTAAGRPTAQTPLSTTTGKLKPEQRARIDSTYARMHIETARGCGHDGGALELRLDRAAGTAEMYVDENWGCKKPPPEIAKGLKDLANALMLVVNAP